MRRPVSAGRSLVALVAGVSAMLTAVSPAAAQPTPPATFSGTVSIDGQPAPDGSEVRASIGGKDCTQAGGTAATRSGSVALYRIQVLAETQEPGCGAPGRTVAFTIAGRGAGQTAPWAAVPATLNLNTGAGQPAPNPTAAAPQGAATPVPSPATIATSTAAPTITTAAPSATPTPDIVKPSDPTGPPGTLPEALLIIALGAVLVFVVGFTAWRQRGKRD